MSSPQIAASSPPGAGVAPARPTSNGAETVPAEGQVPERRRHIRASLLDAMVTLVGEKGYSATSVSDVIRMAGVGRSTFYGFFDNREECFLAAYELSVDRIADELTVVDRVAEPLLGTEVGEQPWPRRIQARLHAVVGLLETEPATARVALIEVTAAGPEALRRYRAALERFTPCLEEGRELSPEMDLPESVALMSLGGAIGLIVDELREDREPNLTALLPDLFFSLLMPFIGADAAAEEMRRAYGDESSAS